MESLTPFSDLGTRSGMSDRVLVRALPHARVATVPGAHVRGLGCLGRVSCCPRPDDIRLQGTKRANGAFLGALAGLAIHYRGFPICPAMAGAELAKDL